MDQFTHIPEDFDNLEKYAPALHRIGKNNTFLIPQNYFNDTPDLVLVEVKMQLLKNADSFSLPANYFEQLPAALATSLKLAELKTKTGFADPGNDYFNDLPEKLLIKAKQVDATPQIQKINVTKIIKLHYKKMAVAASLTVITCLTGWFVKQQQAVTNYDNAAAVTRADIKAYLETTIDEGTLIEYVATNGLSNTEPEVDKKEILNYVIENSDDYKNEINEL